MIPQAKARRHLDEIKEALSPSTHEDSVELKILALNRMIAGWCRYYQHTSKIAIQLSKLEHVTFWKLANWLCHKYRIGMPTCMRRFYIRGASLGTASTRLVKHTSFKRLEWKKGYLTPNPYTTMAAIEREELPEHKSWTGYEERPGWADIRLSVLQRDDFTCGLCKTKVTEFNAQVDHLSPYRNFKRPVDANRPGNLWTLCEDCHKRKTQRDRQIESRVQ